LLHGARLSYDQFRRDREQKEAAMEFDPLWFCGPSEEAAQRQATIARKAYFCAQRRGFEPGHELEDWLTAEAEVNSLVAGGDPHSGGSKP
jgi:hypothetical protein